MRAFLVPAILILAACDAVPDLAADHATVGPPPVILPLDELIELAGRGAAADPGPALDARAASLRARAAALRGPVVAP